MRAIHNQFATLGLFSLALTGLLSPLACDDGDDRVNAGAGTGGSNSTGGLGGEGGATGGVGATESFSLNAPKAKAVGELEFAEELTDVVDLGDYSLGFGKKNAYVLDLSDPKKPDARASFATNSAPVGATFDPTRKLAFLLSKSGELQAFFTADPTSMQTAAALDLSEKDATGIARVGDLLFVLGKGGLTVVSLNFRNGAMASFTEGKTIPLDGPATHLAAGGGQLFIALEGGEIAVYSTTKSPKKNDSYKLGGDVVGWVVRGSQVFAAVKDLGLKVIDFAASGGPAEVYSATDLNDIKSFKRSGNLAVLGLGRNLTVALDVSTLSAPRALVTQAGPLPTWVAPAKGNFVLGSGKSLTVLGVPPFVSASVPSGLRASFPRYGRIPLQLSKPLDPKTLSTETVQLSCAGNVIDTTLAISPDNGRLTLLPKKTLPAGADCSVAFSGVKDPLGNAVSSPGPLGIQTSMAAPGEVMSKKSSYPHKADGAFTDWEAGTKDAYEYDDITAAQGMYSKFYADYDGEKLWILNDWFYNGDSIDPDCYNQFSVYTGGGSQYWDIRAYGDQHIEVRLNGQVVSEDDESVIGGYSHTATPNDPKAHTVYEIAVKTNPGSWSLALHDPGPTFGCDQLETDPTTYDGQSSATQSSVDPTRAPVKPQAPTLQPAQYTTLTPTLSWTSGDQAGNFTVYLFELTRGEGFGAVTFNQWVYGSSFTLPAGLVDYGQTYSWRVTGYNLAGTTRSEVSSFSVTDPTIIVAPKLSGVQPIVFVEDTAASINLTGSGFVQGAQAFLGDGGVSTTFVASDSLTVMLSAEDTATPGTYTLTVRNSPGDAKTASGGVEITVTARVQTECVHSECAPGVRMAAACSACATDVCLNDYAYCCQTEWDAACVARAVELKTCSCTTTGEGGAGGEAGASSAGRAGSAAVGGTAGTGGTTGDAGACTPRCQDATPLGSMSDDNFCNQASAQAYSQLYTCACSTCDAQCEGACAGGTVNQACEGCLAASCSAAYGQCLADGQVDAGAP